MKRLLFAMVCAQLAGMDPKHAAAKLLRNPRNRRIALNYFKGRSMKGLHPWLT